MTDKSPTLAKCAFVLGWIALIGPGLIDGDEVGATRQVAAIVRAELLQTVRSANILAPASRPGSAQAR